VGGPGIFAVLWNFEDFDSHSFAIVGAREDFSKAPLSNYLTIFRLCNDAYVWGLATTKLILYSPQAQNQSARHKWELWAIPMPILGIED
jgi:hypothetical protein